MTPDRPTDDSGSAFSLGCVSLQQRSRLDAEDVAEGVQVFAFQALPVVGRESVDGALVHDPVKGADEIVGGHAVGGEQGLNAEFHAAMLLPDIDSGKRLTKLGSNPTELIMADLHPFELAGLGVAPFRCLGVYDAGKVARGCNYCGTGIRIICRIRSRDGKEFVVGCDCVMKLQRVDNVLTTAVEKARKAIEREKREKRNEARRLRELAKMRALRATVVAALEADRSLLADAPHVSGYFANQGLTLRDWAEYLVRPQIATENYYGGRAGIEAVAAQMRIRGVEV